VRYQVRAISTLWTFFTKRSPCQLFLELDGLKQIDDHYGHQTGSRALCRLGQRPAFLLPVPPRRGVAGTRCACLAPETGAAATLVARPPARKLECIVGLPHTRNPSGPPRNIKAYLERERPNVLPKSPEGQAIAYTLLNWKALRCYCEDGDLAIDNNGANTASGIGTVMPRAGLCRVRADWVRHAACSSLPMRHK
jgi:hypothetical protein